MSKLGSIKIVSLLWFGSILGAGCAFLTQILLARELGPEAFGAFSAALGLVTLVTPLAAFGLGGFWLKVFGEEGWLAMRWLSGSFQYIALSSAFAFSVLLGWIVLGPNDSSSRGLLAILTIFLLGQLAVELVSAKLQLEERYVVLGLWQFLPHFLRLLSIGVLAKTMANLMTLHSVAYTYALVSLGLFAFGAFMLWRMYLGRFDLKGHGAANVDIGNLMSAEPVWKIAKQSWMFGCAGIFHLIYFQSDIVILKYLRGDTDAGVFNVAFTIMVAVYMLPSVVYQKFLLPKIHRWANHDWKMFRQVYYAGNWLMLGAGIISLITVLFFSAWGVQLFFGGQYKEAELPLCILAFAAPFRFVATSVGSTLVTRNNMRQKVRCMGAAALINISLNFCLIPMFGVIGAAVATVLSEISLLGMYYWSARSIFDNSKGVAL